MGYKLLQLLWISFRGISKILEIKLSNVPAITLFNIYPKNLISYYRDICTFISQ